ncbi:unnamed protein product, partial [Ectocarpus sp. 13 AM-2016]
NALRRAWGAKSFRGLSLVHLWYRHAEAFCVSTTIDPTPPPPPPPTAKPRQVQHRRIQRGRRRQWTHRLRHRCRLSSSPPPRPPPPQRRPLPRHRRRCYDQAKTAVGGARCTHSFQSRLSVVPPSPPGDSSRGETPPPLPSMTKRNNDGPRRCSELAVLLLAAVGGRARRR